jgi:RNA polymerase sigma factor (sigma-70 family)
MPSPLAETWTPDPPDEELVARALAGSAADLEVLLRRHERWIYNVALRMLQRTADAEDATQEALLRIVTRLSTFRGESAFRTWAYRIAFRRILDHRRSRPEETVHGFECYGAYLAAAPDGDLADLSATSAETKVLVEEAKLSCLLGLLLCLDRDQRLVFVLGELLEVSDAVGAEVLELSRANFRQRLARARHQLQEFLRGRCGLVDPANPCRCARKTRAFVRDGIVDPARLVFAAPHLASMREASAGGRALLDSAVEEAAAAVWRDHPLLEPPDLVARLRDVLHGETLRAALRLH